MRANDYQRQAMRTANIDILEDNNEKLYNGILGVIGEVGEIADHLKKVKYQGHELDVAYLVEELGDVCWYIALLAAGLGTDLETVMRFNVEKLLKRYPNGFEKSRSINREEQE